MARNARQNLKFLRSFLAESGADVFFHFWDTPDRDVIVRALQPRAHVFETRDQAPPRATPARSEKFVPPSRATNIPSMFYSIMRANELKRAYEEAHGFRYDVVVRLRLDFYTVTTLEEVLRRLPTEPDAWERTLYVPDQAHAMGLNDQVALGSSETMDVYASAFTRLSAYESEDLYVAEYFLLRHVVRERLRIRAFPFEYVLLRADPIATFDLEERVRNTRWAWWSAQVPNIAPDAFESYLVATADSVSLIDELKLETPKAFRLRAAAKGYVRFDAATDRLSVVGNASDATQFVVLVANDEDRRAVNIRPREIALGRRPLTPGMRRGINVRPDAHGVLHPTGVEEDEAAFLIARKGNGITFEWRPGFWTSPSTGATPRRRPGGREQNPVVPPRETQRLFIRATADGLRLAPGGESADAFVLEYVPDPTLETSAIGLRGGVYTGPPRAGDPVFGRVLWMGYLGVRTLEERGPRVVLNRAVAYVRRRIRREPSGDAAGVASEPERTTGGPTT